MIEKIKLKAGLEFKPENITVIVGPNNAGKSTLLNDIIGELQGREHVKKVIRDIYVKEISPDEAKEFFRTKGKAVLQQTGKSREAKERHKFFPYDKGQNFSEYTEEEVVRYLTSSIFLSTRYRMIESNIVKNLNGESRLHLYSSQSFKFKPSIDDVLSNIEKLVQHEDMMKEFSSYLYDALGYYPAILPDNNGQAELVLLKSPLPEKLKFSYSLETLDLLENGKKYSEVSDGIKAFVGILLEIITGDLEIILIDEIEAFLHAPLSRKLGKIISKVSKEKNKQLFITTHNTNFIMGCIDSGTEFNILRLTYNDDIGEARLIEKDVLKKIVKNPLLRSSGVFEGMFYKNVVVCEADSDRIFYQEINYRLQEFNDSRFIEDCLFLNARNKQTVGDITKMLREFGIRAVSIIDFDFIKEGGKEFTNYLKQHNIPEIMHRPLSDYKTGIYRYFKENDEFYDKKNSKIKTEGMIFLDDDHKSSCEALLASLNNYGLFPVPIGEVEAWLQDVESSRHGNQWLTTKLENMGEDPYSPDYVRPDDRDVWNFIGEIRNWLYSTTKTGMS